MKYSERTTTPPLVGPDGQLLPHSFVFYRSFLDAIEEASDEQQLQLYRAIVRYGLNREEPQLKGLVKALWLAFKPILDANYQRWLNSLNRGPKPTADNQASTEPQPNGNQTATEPQPYVYVSVDDSVDASVDASDKVNADVCVCDAHTHQEEKAEAIPADADAASNHPISERNLKRLAHIQDLLREHAPLFMSATPPMTLTELRRLAKLAMDKDMDEYHLIRAMQEIENKVVAAVNAGKQCPYGLQGATIFNFMERLHK